jgi:hypothetical protein
MDIQESLRLKKNSNIKAYSNCTYICWINEAVQIDWYYAFYQQLNSLEEIFL